jgi:hypothetical protein
MTEPNSGIRDRKQQVVALIKSLETRGTAPLAAIDAQNYKQHNLGVEDGLDHVGLRWRVAPILQFHTRLRRGRLAEGSRASARSTRRPG